MMGQGNIIAVIVLVFTTDFPENNVFLRELFFT